MISSILACRSHGQSSLAGYSPQRPKDLDTNEVAEHACVCVLVARSCLTLCDPVNCSPPGSSVLGILQARILEWVAVPFSRGASQPADRLQVFCTVGRLFTICKLENKGQLPPPRSSLPSTISILSSPVFS